MKHKLSWICLALMALLGVYSAVAWRLLRGAGAYRLGTNLGSVLSRSWQYTALAALLLLLVLGIPALLRLKRSKLRSAAQSGTADKLHAKKPVRKKAAAKSEPQKDMPLLTVATAPMSGANKIPPAGATVPMSGADQIPPAGATVPMSGADQMNPAGATVPMSGEEEVLSAAAAAPLPQMEVRPPVSSSPRPVQCAQCGAALTPNQRFCTKCGTPVEGGGPA